MNLPPVIDRELRVALRRRGAHSRWMKTARVAGVAAGVILVFAAMEGKRVDGRLLFKLLFIGGCHAVVMGGIRITSDLFSEERRNRTMELLVMTGLGPLEIFTSKLVGALLTLLYGVGGAYRIKLAEELRDIACAPIPLPGDKAFAGWNPEKIKPPEQWRNWVVGGRAIRKAEIQKPQIDADERR